MDIIPGICNSLAFGLQGTDDLFFITAPENLCILQFLISGGRTGTTRRMPTCRFLSEVLPSDCVCGVLHAKFVKNPSWQVQQFQKAMKGQDL